MVSAAEVTPRIREPGSGSGGRDLSRVGRGDSIASRLLIGLAAAGLATVVVSVAVMAALDYRGEMAALDARALEIERTQGVALAISLWSLDDRQATAQVEGLIRAPDVVGASIHDGPAGGRTARTPWVRAGRAPIDGDRVHAFRLVGPPGHAAAGVDLGEAEVAFDLAGPRGRVWSKLRTSALAQVAVLGLLVCLIVPLVRRLVTRDLERLAQRAAALDLDDPTSDFAVRPLRRGRTDEIDLVIGALESMRLRLAENHRTLAENRAALERDVEARRRAESEARFISMHDPLTGLPNRLSLMEHIVQALAQPGAAGAAIFIDLDNFKYINDARGHRFGDSVLCACAQRIAAVLDGDCFLARFGGDEFVILRRHPAGDPAASAGDIALLQEVHAALQGPLTIGNQAVVVHASSGMAQFEAGAVRAEDLIRNADTAMYRAKAGGRNRWSVFEPSMLASVERRHALEIALRAALSERRIDVVLQAIHDRDGALVAAEALVRWTDPRHGVVSPAEFVPVCEAAGLVPALTDRVLDLLLPRLRRWIQRGHWPQGAYATVNISASQLGDAGFASHLLARLGAEGVAPQAIAIEITEGVLLGDTGVTLESMRRLGAAGVRILIDDFGTGFSCLAYLGRLPLHGLKIDRSFVADLGGADGSTGEAVVASVLSIARHLGMAVVAEGVETALEHRRLSELGCRLFQGYLVHRPVPIERFEADLGTAFGNPGSSAPVGSRSA